MKRNLSSQAIRAMAIGMAVTLGSATAVSGVVTGTVVNVYAATQENGNTKPNTTNKYIEYQMGEVFLNFEVTNEDSTDNNDLADGGKAKLVSITTSSKNANGGDRDGTATKPFIGEISSNMLKVTYNNDKKVYFEVDTIGDGTNPLSAQAITIDGTEFAKITKKVTTINNKAFQNITVTGDLDFSSSNLKDISEKAFYGTTVNGNLTLKGNISAPVKYKDDGTIESTKKVFTNLTVTGNLDLSELTIKDDSGYPNKDGLSILGLGFREGNDQTSKDEKGVKVLGKLIVPENLALDNYALRNVEIGELDLTKTKLKAPGHEGKDYIIANSFAFSKIGTLKFPEVAKQVGGGAFKGTHLDLSKVDFSKIERIAWNSFAEANITGDVKFAPGVRVDKEAFSVYLTDSNPIPSQDKNTIINGNIDLSGASFENGAFPFFEGAIINGDLDLSNVKNQTWKEYEQDWDEIKEEGEGIPDIANNRNEGQKKNPNHLGAFGGMTVKGNIKLDGNTTFPKNTFKDSTLPNQFDITVSQIAEGAFDLANKETVTINIKNIVTNEIVGKIDSNAFGSRAKINLVIPIGSDIDALKDKLKGNTNVTVMEQTSVESQEGVYTFEKLENEEEVALVEFKAKNNTAIFAKNDVEINPAKVSFINGTLTIENTNYTLTKIGNGKNSLTDLTDSALSSHTKNVKEISPKAFEGNKNVNYLHFPKVEKVGENAFANATSLSNLELGTGHGEKIIMDKTALTGCSGLSYIQTNNASKDTVKDAVKESGSSNTTVNGEKPSEGSGSGGSGSGGGSSSGGSGGGSGANIGTITNKESNTEANTEKTTSQGNNNNETVVENKQLSFDVIKLPSVEGEAKVFGDVSANHWAKSYIDKLSTARIINGSNGMFNPNGQTKRADVTVMLVNLLGLTPEANNKFADVNASAYYAPYVGTASNYGIVNGSNGMFNPQGVISRQDTMVMIAQILKGLDLNVNADASALKQFGDANKVSAYANESVAILVNSGIIAGNNGKLNPTAPVTRAEMATIMSKLYDVLASANK